MDPKARCGFILQCCATVFTLLAFILSTVAVSSCAFVGRALSDFASTTIDDTYDLDVTFGMWRTHFITGCIDYDDTSFEVDEAVEAARAFGVLASLLGGIVLVAMIIGHLLVFPLVLWRIILSFLFVIAFFQILTMSFFGSDLCGDADGVGVLYDDCLPDEGAACSIVACVFWITAGVLICLLPRRTVTVIQLCGEGGCCEGDCCGEGGCCDDGCCDNGAPKDPNPEQWNDRNIPIDNPDMPADVVTVDAELVTVVQQ